jgi:hypothetical protein
MAEQVAHETGFFWHLLRSIRKYVCSDPKFASALQDKVDEAKKSGTPVSLPSASVAATLSAALASSIPWLGLASAPVIAGVVLLIWQIGLDAFCSWSDQIVRSHIWSTDS